MEGCTPNDKTPDFVPGNVAATATVASSNLFSQATVSSQHKVNSKVFCLANGFVQFKPATASSPQLQELTAGSEMQRQCMSGRQDVLENDTGCLAADIPARKVNNLPGFYIHNKKLDRPIRLYPTEIISLIQHLPKAYAALNNGNTSYHQTMSKAKAQLVTLEVSMYRERYYLFLKKYFKESPDSVKWSPCKGAVMFDPQYDDPDNLLEFVLAANL